MRVLRRKLAEADSVCPGCGAHVIADGALVNGATFKNLVHFAGDASITGSSFDFSGVKGKVEITAGRGMQITNSQITTGTGNGGILLSGGAGFPPTTTKKAIDLELTFATELIVAWRVWSVVDFSFRGGATEKRLAPYSSALPWEPLKRTVAVCTAGKHHEAPWQTCTCGIWAVRELADLPPVSGPSVTGTVCLWGRVLEFEKGYRAQYAYPEKLIADDQETADGLARIYGVPVTVTGPRDNAA